MPDFFHLGDPKIKREIFAVISWDYLARVSDLNLHVLRYGSKEHSQLRYFTQTSENQHFRNQSTHEAPLNICGSLTVS